MLLSVGLAGCAAPEGGGETIKVGTLLPLTGSLSVFGADMESAVQMAVDEINEAGGVLGRDIELVTGDSRTSSAEAPQEMNRLIQAGVVAVIGAASSGVTGSVLGQAVENQVVMVTPASTAPGLTERQNNGFFYRVPPNDALQGKVMAQILSEDGVRTVSTLYVNNDYGQGFNDVLKTEFLTRYQGVVAHEVAFDEKSTSFDSELSQASSTPQPEAIVFIGYPGEGVPLMRQAFEQGMTDDFTWYFSEGVFDQGGFVDEVGSAEGGEHILAGFEGTTPEALLTSGPEAFQNRFESTFDHKPGLFAAQSYDAMMALALAMAAANSDDPVDFKEKMLDIWNAPGQKVSSASDGLSRAADGNEIDYKGVSGDFDWNDNGDPVKGIYAIWTVGDDGTIEVTERGIEKSL